MKNNDKVRDVRGLACKIKVLNGRIPGTLKWTIGNNDMVIPRHNTELFKRSFQYSGPQLWNNIYKRNEFADSPSK